VHLLKTIFQNIHQIIEKATDSGLVSQQAKVDAEQRRIEESDRYVCMYICIYTYMHIK
jgi:hypothetical protein